MESLTDLGKDIELFLAFLNHDTVMMTEYMNI